VLASNNAVNRAQQIHSTVKRTHADGDGGAVCNMADRELTLTAAQAQPYCHHHRQLCEQSHGVCHFQLVMVLAISRFLCARFEGRRGFVVGFVVRWSFPWATPPQGSFLAEAVWKDDIPSKPCIIIYFTDLPVGIRFLKDLSLCLELSNDENVM
jgi:hypothetical protein